VFQVQQGQKLHINDWIWRYTAITSATVGKINRKIVVIQASLGKSQAKISQAKRAGGVTQAAKNLPSKCKTLSSNTRTVKKKKKNHYDFNYINHKTT
jgi:hypothetical protein